MRYELILLEIAKTGFSILILMDKSIKKELFDMLSKY